MTPGRGLASLLFTAALALASMTVTSGCGSTEASSGPALQALDTKPVPGVPFDANEIIPYAAFIDSLSFAPSEIQQFLEMNPYGTTSFLATYQSGGIFAADSIAEASATYQINPIVLLVRAEVNGGLVGAQTYPMPSQEVEYVFGCGCTTSASCDPSFAGLDKQFDCLASTLRDSIDQVEANGQTAGGWAPGRQGETQDGVEVTPKDASTAALYQYDPIVGKGKSDNWLVWNIWQLYTTFLSYLPPPDPAADATAQVGDPCIASSDCAYSDPVCATGKGYPGGMCTAMCSGSCESMGAFCADFTSAGYCLALCDPTDPASCRAGYTCTLIHEYMSKSPTAAANVCAPM
jgi:hypothetical protein